MKGVAGATSGTGIVVVLLALVTPAGAAAAPAARLGEPLPGLRIPAEALSLTGASNAQGGIALAFFEHRIGRNAREIVHRDADGVWRRFEIEHAAFAR